MKKALIILFSALVVFTLVGCNSSSTKSTLTLDDVKNVFIEKSAKLQTEKPLFESIGAKDGYMFYLDGNPIKLYYFESDKSYNDAIKDFSFLKDMPKKELIVLDTSYEKAIEIFNSIGK